MLAVEVAEEEEVVVGWVGDQGMEEALELGEVLAEVQVVLAEEVVVEVEEEEEVVVEDWEVEQGMEEGLEVGQVLVEVQVEEMGEGEEEEVEEELV